MTQYRNPLQVVVFPYRIENKKVEFLLMRRLPHGGGFWQGVTGGVKFDEEIEKAAERELKEETGYNTTPLPIHYQFQYPVEDQYRHRYSPEVRIIKEYTYIADVSNLGDPVLSHEHDAYRWVTYEGFDLAGLKWDDVKIAITKAKEFIFISLEKHNAV